jgi:hypothetical protein
MSIEPKSQQNESQLFYRGYSNKKLLILLLLFFMDITAQLLMADLYGVRSLSGSARRRPSLMECD